MAKHALIVAGGKRPSQDLLKKYLEKADFVIAADSGANALVSEEIDDLTLVGDFDSIKPETMATFEKRQVPVQKSNTHKDETDTMLAVDVAIKKGAKTITILGALGKRLDHQYANLQLLLYIKQKGAKAELVDEHTTAFLAQKNNTFNMQVGGAVSVFSLSKKSKFKGSKGLKYPLDKLTLFRNKPIGVSNQAIASKIVIKLKSGKMLIIIASE